MKTKEKEALTTPSAPAESPLRPSALSGLEATSFDGRLIQFARATPLMLTWSGGKADPKELQSLAELLNKTFPELGQLRAKLQHTMNRRDDLTQTLMRFMRGSYPQLAALMDEDADPNNRQRNDVIDHSARLMWELSEAEERFQTLADRLNKLEASLEEVIEAPYQRFVRWAIRQSR